MHKLIKLLESYRGKLFDPTEYNGAVDYCYQIVMRAIAEKADIITFTEDDIGWSKEGQILHKTTLTVEGRSLVITWADAWRKILERDKEVAEYFEVLEDTSWRICCKIIWPL